MHVEIETFFADAAVISIYSKSAPRAEQTI